jgi:ankyrin repeat protein
MNADNHTGTKGDDEGTAVNVDALVARFSTGATVTTPEDFSTKRKQQQVEAAGAQQAAREHVTGLRLSLRSAMAAVRPRTIANMATKPDVSFSFKRKASERQHSVVSSPSEVSLEANNPTFRAEQHERDPLWPLAEAIFSDDASNLFACIERCQNADNTRSPAGNLPSHQPRDRSPHQVQGVYDSLRDKIAAGDIRHAILSVGASFNRLNILSAMLANQGGTDSQEVLQRPLEIALEGGHLEIATLLAHVRGGRVGPELDASQALRYYCLAGDIERAREVLANPQLSTIKAALSDASRNGRGDIVEMLSADTRFDPFVDGDEAFRVACEYGKTKIVSQLLANARMSFPTPNGPIAALTAAALAGQCDVVDMLVRDPRVHPGGDRSFALEYYCLAGDAVRAKEVLDDPKPVCLNAALLAVSKRGHVGILKLLLADPRVDPAANDNAAIQASSENGHAEVVKLLLTDPRVDPAADDNYSVQMSGAKGHAEVVRLLLADPRVDPAANDNFAVQRSSEHGHVEVVKLLLADPRVDPTADDNYAIHWSSANEHADVVKLLLTDPRVDPATNDNCAVRWSSENGHAEVVKLLLANPRVDPAADDHYAILWSSTRGHAEVVKLLLADPRVDPAADDNCAVRWSSENGQAVVVKLLLTDPRVDPAADDNYAIQWSSARGHAEVVRLLLADPRVDPTVDDNDAIRLSSQNGHAEVVKLLLADSRVHSCDDLSAALELASGAGHIEVVQQLLLHAEKMVVTRKALTAADKGNHDTVTKFLLEKQPKVLLDLFKTATPCNSDGWLRSELRRMEFASAMTLLLAVERRERDLRLSDILRRVMTEYACFEVVEATEE